MKKQGNRRKTGKEQYYTLPEIAEKCTDEVLGLVGTHRTFLEPCGGEGTFIESLIGRGVNEKNIVSFDIEPKHTLVIKKDFLTTTNFDLGFSTNLVTITNPPFGRANSLSKKFFNHCAEFSEYICFIVPKSWRKWSVQNSLNLNFHLKKDLDLPPVCFYSAAGDSFEGESLNCVFQIWQRSKTARKIKKVADHGLIEKTTPKEADVALTIFGWSCGKLLKEFDRNKNTTLMFLKVKNKKVIKALEAVDYSRFSKNVAYTQALSIQEINYLLNEYFGFKKFE